MKTHALRLVCGLVLAAGIEAAAQSAKSYKARLAPVPVDLAMMANIAGSGSAAATLTGNKLTITGTFDGLRSNATVARLHKGPVMGVRGPAIADLTVTSGTSGTLSGSVELTSIQVTDLDKKRLYVQIHSEKAPDGNLWGWLIESKR
jgi:hypothetical protein